jgi:hypothetical protein
MTVEEIACEVDNEPRYLSGSQGAKRPISDTFEGCLRFSPENSSDAVEISLSGKYFEIRGSSAKELLMI